MKLNLSPPPPRTLSSSSAVLFILLLVVLISNLISSVEAITLPNNMTVPAVLVFGDSIVDQGNNNDLSTIIKCNFPPYGKDFMGGNKPTGRFTNGRTPADLIAEELNIKEILPAYLDPQLKPEDLPTGVSFASGATGFDPQTSQLASVISMTDQVKLFKEYLGKLKVLVGEEGTSNILANAIFLVVAGSDDLANTYFTIGIRKTQYDINAYTDLLVQKATEFVNELYQLGAKRIPVFGIPPIGCLPSQRTLGGGRVSHECVESYNQAGQLMNAKLSYALTVYNNSLNDPKARVVYVDAYNPLLDLIVNHQKYGFDVVEKGCCGTGTVETVILCNKLSGTCPDDSVYLFWDSYHPTENGYKALVSMILQKSINQFV